MKRSIVASKHYDAYAELEELCNYFGYKVGEASKIRRSDGTYRYYISILADVSKPYGSYLPDIHYEQRREDPEGRFYASTSGYSDLNVDDLALMKRAVENAKTLLYTLESDEIDFTQLPDADFN